MTNAIISFIIICISYISFVYIYKKISEFKNTYVTFKNALLIMIFSYFTLLIGITDYLQYTRIYLNIALLYIIMSVIFKENAKTTLIKTLILYFIELILELVFSIIFICVPLENILNISTMQIIIKNLFSLIIILIMLLIVNIRYLKNYIRKISMFIIKKNEKNINFLLYLFIGFMIYLIICFTLNSDKDTYLTNAIFISITFICFIMIVNYQDEIIRREEKQNIILEFMKSYEISIDKYRIYKHEILNNLITLSTYKNKNSKEFAKQLNKLIIDYSQNIDGNLNNIGNLPYGIKGVLYYKINSINNENIKFTFNYSKSVEKYLSKTNLKDYDKLCKMLGIFMDNAIEAAKDSIQKSLVLDIYLENKKVIFYIENSFKNNFDLKKIKLKNFSTKGKFRGLGLYIVDKIYSKSKALEYYQYIKNNNFITIIKLKI